jgi:peptidoglycan/xylan/chitin deacetylase (PgdA/CDA1 family)
MRHIPILLYHSIDTTCAPAYRRWTVTPDRFSAHVRYLAEQGYTPITISELATALIAGQRVAPLTVVITFDDGLRDFGRNAVPILRRFDFPATLFVVTGHVGATSAWLRPLGEGDRPMLSWGEISELGEQGIECGAHSHSHKQLDVLRPAMAFEEIKRSKSTLEHALGRAVRSFAYPHGYANAAVRRTVMKLGFTSACRVRHALSSPEENRYALSRIIMTDDVEEDDFAELLGGHTLPVAPATDRLAADGWRLARRVRHLVRTAM